MFQICYFVLVGLLGEKLVFSFCLGMLKFEEFSKCKNSDYHSRNVSNVFWMVHLK